MDFDARLQNKPPKYHNDRLYFFKYMSAGTAKIVLKNKTLRWSTSAALNDQFDMQLDLPIRVGKEELTALALDKLWQVYSQPSPIDAKNTLGILLNYLRASEISMTKDDFAAAFRTAVEEGYETMMAKLPEVQREAASLMADTKILSLTTRPDNTLMWAHYASSASGVVLRFRSIPEMDGPFGMAKPMNYVNAVPELFDATFLADTFAGIATMDSSALTDKVVYTKSAHWEYEQEWRICAGAGRNRGATFEDCPYGVEEVDGIIFGLRTSKEDRDELLAITADFPSVNAFQVIRPNRESFDLKIVST